MWHYYYGLGLSELTKEELPAHKNTQNRKMVILASKIEILGFLGVPAPLQSRLLTLRGKMIGRLFITVFSRKNHLAVEFGNMRRHVLSAGYGNSQKN